MTTKPLNPLPKSVTKQIREILRGTASGKLEHNQNSIHCGAAHCIAGWYQYFKYTKQGFKYDIDLEIFTKGDVVMDPGINKSAWSEAQEDWGLTNTEANLLFSDRAIPFYQFALLEWLEEGKRVEDFRGLPSVCYKYLSPGGVKLSISVENSYCEFLEFTEKKLKRIFNTI